MCSVNFKHFSCDCREHPLSFPSKKEFCRSRTPMKRFHSILRIYSACDFRITHSLAPQPTKPNQSIASAPQQSVNTAILCPYYSTELSRCKTSEKFYKTGTCSPHLMQLLTSNPHRDWAGRPPAQSAPGSSAPRRAYPPCRSRRTTCPGWAAPLRCSHFAAAAHQSG